MELLNLAWFIPLFPFLAFVTIALFTSRRRDLSHSVAIGGIAIAFVLAQLVFWRAVTLPVGGGEHAYHPEGLHWLATGLGKLGLSIYIDPATAVMLFMVPLVCLMIFIYSVGYMAGDPRYSRFFAYISLFATGMLGLVVFDSLLTLFIFWEIMGTCSYLLIGFWYEKESAYRAGLKAFLVTKVGDLFLTLGLVVLYAEVGTLNYAELFKPETLAYLAHTPFMGTSLSVATVASLLIFGGTVGKSAQFPLHVWLPDAMEGPTPVSALIHAATMVSAGVFLVVRAFPLFAAVQGGPQMTVVAVIGTFTAIFASIIAIAQNDVKRVLAFSTISQLGYMIAALGIGAYVAGAFHLITHAFFKALLFLSSGSVIHGMEHGHHHVAHHGHDDHGHGHAFNPNDMMGMGGLARRMPRTWIAFLIGGLALSGFPIFTAGFWSKDEILAQAYEAAPAVFWTLAVAAFITAFYTARQLCLTFLGEPRSEAAAHAPESVPAMTVPLLILAAFSVVLGWVGIPEHFPVLGGVVPNWFHHFMMSTIESEGAHAAAAVPHLAEVVSESAPILPLIAGLIAGLGGLTTGWLVYGRKPLVAGQMDPVEAGMRKLGLGFFYEAMRDRFYFDELYAATVVWLSKQLAEVFAWFDRTVVDGLVNGAARLGRALSALGNWLDTHLVDPFVNLMGWLGRGLSALLDWLDQGLVDGLVNLTGQVMTQLGATLRVIQSGNVQDYLWLALLTVVVLVMVFILRTPILM